MAEPPIAAAASAPWGRFDIELAVIVGDHAPADAAIRLDIRPTNAVGQEVPASVTWHIEGPGISRSGQGLQHEANVVLPRGEHHFSATADAPDFKTGLANATVRVLPVPLAVDLEVPANATRGEWFQITAIPSHGFSDETAACQWGNGSAQFIHAGACSTQARWLEDGDHVLEVTVDDGRDVIVASATMESLPRAPLPAPTVVPDEVHVSASAGPSADDPYLPHNDVTAAWFDSDIDALYVGLAVRGATDPLTQTGTYRVSFDPSWEVALEGDSMDRLRVVTTWQVLEGTDLSAPDGIWTTVVEGQSDGEWSVIASLPATRPDEGSGITWWVVPRAAIQAPLDGASISAFVAQAGSLPMEDPWDSAAADGPYALT